MLKKSARNAVRRVHGRLDVEATFALFATDPNGEKNSGHDDGQLGNKLDELRHFALQSGNGRVSVCGKLGNGANEGAIPGADNYANALETGASNSGIARKLRVLPEPCETNVPLKAKHFASVMMVSLG